MNKVGRGGGSFYEFYKKLKTNPRNANTGEIIDDEERG